LIENALKSLSVSAQKKPAIVKADPDPAIIAALDNLADLTLQRHLGSPWESLSDQSDPIANFETGFQFRFLLHFPFAFGAGTMTWPSLKTTFSTPIDNLCPLRHGFFVPRWNSCFDSRAPAVFD